MKSGIIADNLLIGTICVSQYHINIQVRIVDDKNPIHKKGVVPFYMTEGLVSALIQDWAKKNGFSVPNPRIEKAEIVLAKQLHTNREYSCFADITKDPAEKTATIVCRICNFNSKTVLQSFSMKLKHR